MNVRSDEFGSVPLTAGFDGVSDIELVDGAPDGIVVADEAGRILMVNRQIETLFGYPRADLVGEYVEILLPEQVRAVHRAHRTRYRAAPEPRNMGAGLILAGRRQDGTEFPVEISLSPIARESGIVVVAAIRDTTERSEAQARLNRIHRILDATNEGIFVFDAATLRFDYVNHGAVDQVKYSREELLTMTPLHLAPELTEAQLRTLIAGLDAASQFRSRIITTYRRSDGVDIPVEIVFHIPVVDDSADLGPLMVVALARDITDEIETAAQQRKTEHALQLVEDRERMARDLHDVVIQRLFATGLAAQALQARVTDTALAARAGAIVDQLDETIREIRTVIFSLQAPNPTEELGFRRQLLDLVEEFRDVLGFTPRLSFSGSMETVRADTVREILAILGEALTNVARHAHATAVEVMVEADGDLFLRVLDNGIGLADTRTDGNGLRNMVDRAALLGGLLTAKADADNGTVVECRVPIS